MGKVITQKELNELLSSNKDFGLGDDYCPTYEEINGAWRDHKLIFKNNTSIVTNFSLGALDTESGQIYRLISDNQLNGYEDEFYLKEVLDVIPMYTYLMNGRYLKKFYLCFNVTTQHLLDIKVEYNNKTTRLCFASYGGYTLAPVNTVSVTSSFRNLYLLDEISDEGLMTDLKVTVEGIYDKSTYTGEWYNFNSTLDGSHYDDTLGGEVLTGTQSISKWTSPSSSTNLTVPNPEVLNQTTENGLYITKSGSNYIINNDIVLPEGFVGLVASSILEKDGFRYGQVAIISKHTSQTVALTDNFRALSGNTSASLGIDCYSTSGVNVSSASVSLNGSGSYTALDPDINQIKLFTNNSTIPVSVSIWRRLVNDTDWVEYFKATATSSANTYFIGIGYTNLYKLEARLPEKCVVRFRRGFYPIGSNHYMSTKVGLTATLNSSQSQTLIYNSSNPYVREASLYNTVDSPSGNVRIRVSTNANIVTSSSVSRYVKVVFIDHDNSILTMGSYSILSSTSTQALLNIARDGGLPIKAVSIDLFDSTTYTSNTYGAAVVIDTTELSTRNTTNYCRIFTNSSAYQLYFYLDGTMNPMWLGSTTSGNLSSSACSVYLPSGTVVDYELYDSRKDTPYRTGTINGSGTFGVLKDSSYSSGNIRIKLKDVKEDTSPLTITLTDASLSLRSDYEISVNYHLSRLTTVRDIRADVEVYDSATSAVLYTNAITIPAYSNGDKTHLIEGFSVEEFDKYATGGNSLGIKLKPNSTNPDYVTVDSTPKNVDFSKYTNYIYYDVIDDTHISMSTGYYEFSIASTYPVRSNISITGVYSVDYETRSGESYSTEVSVPFSIPSGSHTSSTVKVTTNSISFDYTPYRINSCSWLEFRNLNIQSDTWFNYDY